MICVKIELLSAVTLQTSEIGRMYLANDGRASVEDPSRGDYLVAVCRRGTDDVPMPIDPEGPQPTRAGEVKDYPRLANNVWRLITRACLAAFPEEATPRKRRDAAVLDAKTMKGLRWLLRMYGDASDKPVTAENLEDVLAACEWLETDDSEEIAQ